MSGGSCSITFGTALSVRLTADGDRLHSHVDVYAADGHHVATLRDDRWDAFDPSFEAQVVDGTAILRRGDEVLVKLVVRARFAKLVHADFYGPAGQRVLIGSDGALHLLNARNQSQVEVADCEFVGEAHFCEVDALAAGACTSVHGSGVSYTRDAIGQRILESEFEPADMSAQMLAAAGISMN